MDTYKHLKNFSNAARLFHECILNAKCYTQMTTTLLQEVAREVLNTERDNAKSTQQESILFINEEELKASGSSKTIIEQTPQKQSKQITRTRLDSTSHGEEMKNAANDLIVQCYYKLAACILNGPPRKNDDYLRAVYYCDKVMKLYTEKEVAYL